MKIRFFTLVLCVSLIFAIFSTACIGNDSDDTMVDANLPELELNYEPLLAGNEKLLYNNPDRGFRTEMVFTIYDKHPDPENEGKYNDHCDLINSDGSYNRSGKCSGKHDVRDVFANIQDEDIEEIINYIFRIYFPKTAECQSKLALVFIGFPDYNKGDLPDRCLEVLQMLFDRFRTQKAKLLWRHSYCPPWLDWKVSEANKQKLSEECANQETMFRHIDQLAPLFAKNIDVIHKFSSGFIGNGEFTEAWQWPPIDTNELIKKVLETWCVPNNLYYTVRVPLYKMKLEEAEPDYPYLSLIGNNNDAIFGEQTHGGWNSGCYQKNHNGESGSTKCTNGSGHYANSQWEYMYERAAYTPQSGEMYVNVNHVNTNRVPTGMEVILELARHRYTCFSQWHCLLETASKPSVIGGWMENEIVSPEILDNESILFDPAWFIDENGSEVSRNPYEFIRDHLGYKLTATKASVTDNFVGGKTVNFEVTIKNYGFAAAFNMESGFAILDANDNVISSVKAGEPEKWYSHDPEDHLDTNSLEHTIEAKLKLPKEKGNYKIAFYLKNIGDEFARLSNSTESVSFTENGYNVLYSFEIK